MGGQADRSFHAYGNKFVSCTFYFLFFILFFLKKKKKILKKPTMLGKR